LGALDIAKLKHVVLVELPDGRRRKMIGLRCKNRVEVRKVAIDVRLIHLIGSASELQVRADPLINLRGIPLDPPENRGVVYTESSLFHHLFQISVAKLVTQIPSDAQQDDGGLEVAPLERGLILFQEYDARRVIAKLRCGL